MSATEFKCQSSNELHSYTQCRSLKDENFFRRLMRLIKSRTSGCLQGVLVVWGGG
jgi:hypothetical protein